MQGSWKILLVLAFSLVVRSTHAKGLDLYWVDVEGGAATLIVTPAGESVLIDTGMPGERDPKRIVKLAREIGLKQIDHLKIASQRSRKNKERQEEPPKTRQHRRRPTENNIFLAHLSCVAQILLSGHISAPRTPHLEKLAGPVS